MSKVPQFWWDFVWDDGRVVGCIVESDDPGCPVIATCLTHEEAEEMVADLRAGRLSHRRLR